MWGWGLWYFVAFRIFFSDNTKIRIFFFVGQSANFFFQNLTLGYMTKSLNQIIIFFFHQNQNIFFSSIGNQNIFLEENHNPSPSPPFKLNGLSLKYCYYFLLCQTIYLIVQQFDNLYRKVREEVSLSLKCQKYVNFSKNPYIVNQNHIFFLKLL